MASPTIVIVLAFSRSTVDHTSSGSTRRGSSGNTSVAPWAMSMKQAHCAAPCMSGGSTSSLSGKLSSSRSVNPS